MTYSKRQYSRSGASGFGAGTVVVPKGVARAVREAGRAMGMEPEELEDAAGVPRGTVSHLDDRRAVTNAFSKLLAYLESELPE